MSTIDPLKKGATLEQLRRVQEYEDGKIDELKGDLDNLDGDIKNPVYCSISGANPMTFRFDAIRTFKDKAYIKADGSIDGGAYNRILVMPAFLVKSITYTPITSAYYAPTFVLKKEDGTVKSIGYAEKANVSKTYQIDEKDGVIYFNFFNANNPDNGYVVDSVTVEYFESENAGLSKSQVVNEIKNFKRAEGKSCNFVGDSITANQNYYYDKVVSATGVVGRKKGIAGSTICKSTFVDAVIKTQNSSIVERITSGEIENADIWLVFGGTNDWYYDCPLGTISDVGSNFDITTVYGALQRIVEYVTSLSNNPKLIFVTPYKTSRNKYMSDHNTDITEHDVIVAIRNVCSLYAIPCVDLWSMSGINKHNVVRSINPTTTDGVHPSDLGSSMIYPIIADAVSNYDILRCPTLLSVNESTGGSVDVQINGSSIVTDGVATIPIIKKDGEFGIAKTNSKYGITISGDKSLYISAANQSDITGRNTVKPITTTNLGIAVKSAMCDGIDKSWTDSEKSGAWKRLNSIKTVMDEVAVSGAKYFLGEQTELTITLPDDALTGQEITVVWYNGETPATLAISGNMLDFDYAPGANSRSVISVLWDGTYWSLISNEQSIPVTEEVITDEA